MIRTKKSFVIDVNRGRNAFSTTANRYNKANLSLFEGDAIEVDLYFYDFVNNSYATIDSNQGIILSFATQDSLKSVENQYLAITEEFDTYSNADGNPYYKGLLELNTDEALNALGTRSFAEGILEVVVVETALGRQTTFQHECNLYRSIAPTSVIELLQPSTHIGSYATVKELCESIADERILALKDGAPAEFDTLFELAHYANKVRSHEIQVGDFCDYLDGKKLVDTNLSVVSLGNIMLNESTYEVSYEPWRPKTVEAEIIE